MPPTQEQLIDLVVSNLGTLLALVPGLILAVLEGLGNPDGLDNGTIDIPDLPPTMQFRIGKLLPSSASFTFTGPGYEHVYTSSVGA